MKIKFILPRIIEANANGYRPIKYSLFPPLGLATLAHYIASDDEAEIVDEHVETLRIDDEPDLVAIEVYVTCAYRAYAIADSYRKRGIHVVMGGLHVTAMPEEAAEHADTIITGPGEEAFPRFLADFRADIAQKHYASRDRSLDPFPTPRRDLIKKQNYLVPNSLTVSRGCPFTCNFCYKENFLRGGKTFYRASLDAAMQEISSLDGKHVFFLDDNIFADEKFAFDLFREMAPLKKVWQGAATVKSLKNRKLLEAAANAGAGSLFIGFESLNADSLKHHGKLHNNLADYEDAIKAVHSNAVMINSSFVYGMECDGPDTFKRTVDWGVKMGLETATFHILTPYPGSELFNAYKRDNRITTENWDLYDTRHCVFKHPTLSARELEDGYMQSYENFYSWKSIISSSLANETLSHKLRHFTYSVAWKKFEFFWRMVIAAKKLSIATPILERVLK